VAIDFETFFVKSPKSPPHLTLSISMQIWTKLLDTYFQEVGRYVLTPSDSPRLEMFLHLCTSF